MLWPNWLAVIKHISEFLLWNFRISPETSNIRDSSLLQGIYIYFCQMLGSKIPSHLGYRPGILNTQKKIHPPQRQGWGNMSFTPYKTYNPPWWIFDFLSQAFTKNPWIFRGGDVWFKVTRFGQCGASLVPHLSGVHGFWLDSCEATQPKFEGVDFSFGVTERLGFNPRVSCLANSSWSIGLFLCLWACKKKQKKRQVWQICSSRSPFSSRDS